MTSLSPLERLAGPGNVLAKEPSEAKEFAGLVRSGLARLKDAQREANSLDSRFDLAYSAAHALCLAALRRVSYLCQEDHDATPTSTLETTADAIRHPSAGGLTVTQGARPFDTRHPGDATARQAARRLCSFTPWWESSFAPRAPESADQYAPRRALNRH